MVNAAKKRSEINTGTGAGPRTASPRDWPPAGASLSDLNKKVTNAVSFFQRVCGSALLAGARQAVPRRETGFTV